ncbi:MAG: WD40 repeat domain-containing protein, partial [Acidobacteriaceae bacterium]|nr:WD40 repeat domain-containing protein [Acidobacteriaceae bacterium]
MSLRAAACLLALSAISAFGATSTAWEISGFSDFLKGQLTGLSLTSDGTLQLGPSLRFNAGLNQPALWSLAPGPDHSVYASSGHQGKVFRISPDGKVSVVWTPDQTEVFALCVDSKGVLYAGSSPNGGLYRIEDGKAREIWHSPEKYIWAIQSAPDGTLYVATGEHGQIYRITSAGAADLYYETGQSNVTALALAAGHLYAGTDPNGLLYDISGPKQGTILFDSHLPEIRAMAVNSDGTVYAAAMGGAVATRSAGTASASPVAAGAVIATSPTVITVTEAKRGTAPSDNEQANIKAATDQTRAIASSASTTTSNTPVVEVSGVEKSAIYKITPNRAIETLRSSQDDNVYDILLDGDSLIFSTDDRGRIYRLNGQKVTLL